MNRARRVLLVGCLVLLVGTAGCLSGIQRPGGPAASPSSPTSTQADGSAETATPPRFREATTTPEPLDGRANCSADLWISSWGLNEPRLWNAQEVRFSTHVPANASYHFVAYVDGTVGGVRHESTTRGGGFTLDGGSVEIAEDLSGEHTVRIVVHRDADGSGTFDPETDPPCYNDRGLVQTEYLVVDFDRYW